MRYKVNEHIKKILEDLGTGDIGNAENEDDIPPNNTGDIEIVPDGAAPLMGFGIVSRYKRKKKKKDIKQGDN